jgi:hypothetical protein
VLEPKQWQVHDSEAVARSPAIGDLGTVVSVDTADGKLLYTVENVDPHGAEVWLAQFEDEELEPMPA